MEYQREHRLPILGEYILAGLDVSAYSHGASYFEEDFPLTKTEAMIIRYLIRCYPAKAKSKNILK